MALQVATWHGRFLHEHSNPRLLPVHHYMHSFSFFQDQFRDLHMLKVHFQWHAVQEYIAALLVLRWLAHEELIRL